LAFYFYFFQISVATFHLGRLELAQQTVGSNACVKLQAASLSGEECPAISWEEFQVLNHQLCLNYTAFFRPWKI
jgi:hypothetical protein